MTEQLKKDMIHCVAELLGPGLVSEYYKEVASDFISAAKSYAERNRPSPWVPVSERLPEIGKTVLVQFDTVIGEPQWTTADYVEYSPCLHSDRKLTKWVVAVSGGHDITGKVTHWMPLPAAPKGLGND